MRALVGHAARGVNDQVRLEVRLLLVLLDEVPVRLAVGAPVDVANLVAGIILAMFSELDGKALVRTLVCAGEETLDELAGDHGQPAVFGEGRRIEMDRGCW